MEERVASSLSPVPTICSPSLAGAVSSRSVKLMKTAGPGPADRRESKLPSTALMSCCCRLAAALFLALTPSASATTRYVDLRCAKPTTPYTSWATASTNIQAAIDVATTGDVIVVTNGVYANGGKAVYGTMTNRVTINKRVALRSVNGADYTIIQGRQLPGTTNGDGAIRCVYLVTGASLSGFTLTGGATRITGDYANERSGGGLWCDTSNPAVSNCVVMANAATGNGGGAFYGTFYNCTLAQNWTTGSGGGASGGTLNACTITSNTAALGGGVNSSTAPGQIYSARLNNCTLIGNSASDSGGGANSATLNNCAVSGNTASNQGGGATASTLVNCTLTGNAAAYGGGTSGGAVTNSIVFFNSASRDGPNCYGGTLSYSCTTPLPSSGFGSISADPRLASASHLSATSPCRGAGTAGATGTDIDGEPWASPPAIGCDEYRTGSVTGALSVAISAACTNVAVGFPVDLAAWINGRTTGSVWDFSDGTRLSNQPQASHAWLAPGDYSVLLTAYNESRPDGVSATVTVQVVEVPVHYVALASPNPTPPYDSWATAATNVQNAVDAATVPGATVLVTNGTYAAGGLAIYGTMTNRVAVTKPLLVRSVNGPELTVIRGSQVPGTTNGDGAIRCVYLARGAFLSGFTLTNGATRSSGDADRELNGGGLWCESASALASNCVVAGSASANYGGGACGGTLINCTLAGNVAAANGGGAYYATLRFCTLSDNRAIYGAGASAGTLNNCILSGNLARYSGGAAYSANLNNCFLTGNSSGTYGGGVSGGTLKNCTLAGNSASEAGGGSYGSVLNNSIIYRNRAPASENSSGGNFNYCCTTPMPDSGTGNIASDPQLAGGPYLSAGSPCRGMGSAVYAVGVDIDGEPWSSPPAIGCAEFYPGAITGPLEVSISAGYTNVAPGFEASFTGHILGHVRASVWDFGDGITVSNRPYGLLHSWAVPGDYTVTLSAYNDSYPAVVSTTLAVHVEPGVHYVAAASPNPVPPYTSWETAARTLQDAIDAATIPGAVVWVTNGLYATGGRPAFGVTTNRVAVDKPLLVQSVNGPQFTMIQGHQAAGTTNGDEAVRCVGLADGASLVGFTLTGGATRAGDFGGGVWCANAVVSNCVMSGNSAANGGGAYRGTLNHCSLSGNAAAYGGGAYACTLNDCTLTLNRAETQSGGGAFNCALNNCALAANSAAGSGGGAAGGTLNNCSLMSNSVTYFGGGASGSLLNNCALVGNQSVAQSGGGAYNCTLNNCVLTGNSAYYNGGGAFGGALNNCTVTGNSAAGAGMFGAGGGTHSSALSNSIVYFNMAVISGPNYQASTLHSCCTTPQPAGGSGNVTYAPLFVDAGGGNLRLQPDSPCINAGNNSYVPAGSDLDGNPRIVSATVDIGAYEFQGVGSFISYAWLQQYSMPTDGSADYLDPDNDLMNNWQEWRCGTDPTNPLSALRLQALTWDASGVVVSWQSVTNRDYWIERATNLTSPSAFSSIASNIAGQFGLTTYTNALGADSCYYRVGVQP